MAKKLSKKARKYIAEKIKKLHEEGYSGKQAVAIAFAYARKRGLKVPKKKKK